MDDKEYCPVCNTELEFESDEINFRNMYWCPKCEEYFNEDELCSDKEAGKNGCK
jgi:uncharacterized protein with PIN domain